MSHQVLPGWAIGIAVWLLSTLALPRPSQSLVSSGALGGNYFLSIDVARVPRRLSDRKLSTSKDQTLNFAFSPFGARGKNNLFSCDGRRRSLLKMSASGEMAHRLDDEWLGLSEQHLIQCEGMQEKRLSNTNRAVATVAYFWWRYHKEKHNTISAESLEVEYNGFLGGGTYGEVFHAVVRRDDGGETRAVAKRARDGSIDPDDPELAETDEEICPEAMDVTCLEQHLAMLDLHNKAFQYLQVEAFMNDLVKQLCPDIAAPYIGMCRRRGMRWLVWEYAGDVSLQALLDQAEGEGSLRPLAAAVGVLGFVDGDEGSLQRVVNEVARQLLDICAALEAAGIAHRDVKPDNLVVSGGRLRLIDFGSAAAMGLQGMVGYDHRTAPCDPCYAPPEQFIDEAEWPKYDVYCVGLTLVRILFQPLWGGQHWFEFSDAYVASGYNLDRWLLRVIRRDPAVRTRGPSPWMRALQTVMGRAPVDTAEQDQRYVDLAAESCSISPSHRLNMCSMKLGLEVLNVKGGGVCWDTLRWMLARCPARRMSSHEARERLHPPRITSWREWRDRLDLEAQREREARDSAVVYVWDGWDVYDPEASARRGRNRKEVAERREPNWDG